MIGRVAALMIVVALGTAADDGGQDQLGLNGYGVLGDMRLDAAQTFEAVSETSHARLFGAGIQVTNIWRSVFVDVAVSNMTIDGERVFFDEARAVQPLGIPLEVSMRYVDVAAGWRARHGRLSPYVGGGFSGLRYRERSELAQPGEDVAEGGVGPLFLAGIDFTLSRWVRIGGEVRYRRVGGVLGAGGASAEFREDSAGGVSTALRVTIGR
jgi:opacity protein-like surface antigen